MKIRNNIFLRNKREGRERENNLAIEYLRFLYSYQICFARLPFYFEFVRFKKFKKYLMCCELN
jgi:hypothetical protein